MVQMGSGERIHYLDWGAPRVQPARPCCCSTASRPPPGAGRPSRAGSPSRLRVLALDMRGHGLSEGARTGLDLESLAWDALTVLAANGAGVEVGGPPAVIAGHGLGAMVAATAARLQPASVAGLALVDGGWEDLGVSTRLSPGEFLAGIGRAARGAGLAWTRSWPTGATSTRRSWDADQERAARAQVDQKHAGHVALVTRQATIRGLVDAMFGYRPIETLAAAPVPLLVLVAGRRHRGRRGGTRAGAGARGCPGRAPRRRPAGGAGRAAAGHRATT